MAATDFRVWLKLNVSLVLLPLLLLFAGLYYLASLQKNANLREFELEAYEHLESLRFYSETEKYLCSAVAGIFDTASGPEQIKTAVQKFARDHRIDLTFFINNPDGSLYFSNVPAGIIEGDPVAVYLDMLKLIKAGFPSDEGDIPPAILANIREVYGPHFFPRYYFRCFSGNNVTLRRGHASLKKPLFWTNFTDRAGLSVLFPPEVVDSFCGVYNHTHNVAGRLKTGYILNGQINCPDPSLAAEVDNYRETVSCGLSSVIRLPGHFLLTNFVDANMLVFAAVESEKIASFSVPILTTVLSLLLLCCFVVFAICSYKSVVRGHTFAIRLKWQLLLLFISSNAISGYVLYAAGSDYLQQYRAGLITDAYNDSMAYLQNIDELFVNELTVQKGRLETSLDKLGKHLKKRGITRREIRKFFGVQRPPPYGFYLVASSTGLVTDHHGSLKHENVYKSYVPGFKDDKIRINTMRAMYKIGTYILASLNKQKISTKAGAEAEMFCEAFTQRSPADLIRMFADRGTFGEWGIGSRRHLTYVNLLQLFSSQFFDYTLLYLWDSDDLEFEFIRRIFHNLNRNELGLRVTAVNEKFSKGFPKKSLSEPTLKRFSLKLRDRSLTRPEVCSIDGSEYLLVGHKCVVLANIRLLGLYPMEKIAALVADKAGLLRILALVSLLVSVSMGLFVAGGILRPLEELQVGIKALNDRDFSWRVPDLGGDEFGHLARVFNETIIDLEELHVASQVQEKLLTRMEAPLNCGCLQFFCCSAGEQGTNVDYFDLFTVAEDCQAIMFGRSAARGVAGSLVLAFVKSACMQLNHLAENPGQMVAALNNLLAKSGNGSGRTMKIQNVLLHSDGRISCAGGGLPAMLVFDSRLKRVEMLESCSDPVGLEAEKSFQTLDLQLSSGQVLVVLSALPENFALWPTILKDITVTDPEEICHRLARHCRVADAEAAAVFVVSCV